jgi:ubiquinone/menaquinone biosynthesis C-methylase UbiE
VDHADHVRLLRDGVRLASERRAAGENGVWLDLGAGTGAFTLALADLLPAGSTIHAMDRDRGALDELERRYRRRRGDKTVDLRTHVADFSAALPFADVDGVVMANSLHFVRDKAPTLRLVRGVLRTGGGLLLVEYDSDRGNQWVPYPISFETWREVAVASGFTEPTLLDANPSRFMGRIYSAFAMRR